MTRPARGTCGGCGGPVLQLDDTDTRERLVLDDFKVDEGDVLVLVAGPVAVGRQLGRPARMQPAHRVHRCPAAAPSSPTLLDRDDPGVEQARWRAP